MSRGSCEFLICRNPKSLVLWHCTISRIIKFRQDIVGAHLRAYFILARAGVVLGYFSKVVALRVANPYRFTCVEIGILSRVLFGNNSLIRKRQTFLDLGVLRLPLLVVHELTYGRTVLQGFSEFSVIGTDYCRFIYSVNFVVVCPLKFLSLDVVLIVLIVQ